MCDNVQEIKNHEFTCSSFFPGPNTVCLQNLKLFKEVQFNKWLESMISEVAQHT